MKLLGRSFTTQEKQIWERSSRRKSHWPPPSAPDSLHKANTGSSYKLLPVAFYAILRNSTSLRTSAAALVWQSVLHIQMLFLLLTRYPSFSDECRKSQSRQVPLLQSSFQQGNKSHLPFYSATQTTPQCRH